MNTMYFTCSTLRTTMRVTACESNRAEKSVAKIKQQCKDCSKWKTETTDVANLKTQEEILGPIQVAAEKPQPVRFDHRYDMTRVGRLEIGHGPYRDSLRKS